MSFVTNIAKKPDSWFLPYMASKWAIDEIKNPTTGGMGYLTSLSANDTGGASLPGVVSAPATTPASIDTTAQDAATAEAARLKKKKGMLSTILTGSEGDQSAPSLLSQKLGE